MTDSYIDGTTITFVCAVEEVQIEQWITSVATYSALPASSAELRPELQRSHKRILKPPETALNSLRAGRFARYLDRSLVVAPSAPITQAYDKPKTSHSASPRASSGVSTQHDSRRRFPLNPVVILRPKLRPCLNHSRLVMPYTRGYQERVRRPPCQYVFKISEPS